MHTKQTVDYVRSMVVETDWAVSPAPDCEVTPGFLVSDFFPLLFSLSHPLSLCVFMCVGLFPGLITNSFFASVVFSLFVWELIS